jgi:hypothetical protein
MMLIMMHSFTDLKRLLVFPLAAIPIYPVHIGHYRKTKRSCEIPEAMVALKFSMQSIYNVKGRSIFAASDVGRRP